MRTVKKLLLIATTVLMLLSLSGCIVFPCNDCEPSRPRRPRRVVVHRVPPPPPPPLAPF